MKKHKFTIDIDPIYSDNDECNISTHNIINDKNINKLCNKFLGRKCEPTDLEVYTNNDYSSLENCNKWYSFPIDDRYFRFSNNISKSDNNRYIDYLLDPYNTGITILNATYKNELDHRINFEIDTGNEELTSINSDVFADLVIKPRIATNDMIFMYNHFSIGYKINPIGDINEYINIDMKTNKNMITNFIYPEYTYEKLYELCDVNLPPDRRVNPDTWEADNSNNGMSSRELQLNIIGFDKIISSGNGKTHIFETTTIKIKFDGINDKIFEFECGIDNTLDVDILFSYKDIAYLYEHGIDIGFNKDILDHYKDIDTYNNLLLSHIKNLYRFDHIYKSNKYKLKYNPMDITIAKYRYYHYANELNFLKNKKFSAYKI